MFLSSNPVKSSLYVLVKFQKQFIKNILRIEK